MLDITSISEDSKIHHRLYDVKRCDFYDKNGDKIDLNIDFGDSSNTTTNDNDNNDTSKNRLSESDWLRITNNISSSKKYPNMYLLKIQMGLSCNYRCGYCIQGGFHPMCPSTDTDVDNFIKTFDDWCTSKSDQPMQIQLWGGEPLLYSYAIYKLIPFFRQRFENPMISVVSNGSLFNKEFADFFLVNNVEYVVSHDGPTQLLGRTGDPLSEGSESLKWIKYYAEHEIIKDKKMAFNSVITKSNLDLKSVVTYINNIVGDKSVVNFEGIVTVGDVGRFDENSLFTSEDYSLLRSNIINLLRDGSFSNIGPFNMKFGSIISSWFNKDFFVGPDSFQKCGMDNPFTMAVDLKGNVLKCHSNIETIGKTSNLDDINLYDNITRWNQREKCNECIVLNLCRGACMLVDDLSWEYTCDNEFNFNLAVFEAAFEYIFKERIIQIDR